MDIISEYSYINNNIETLMQRVKKAAEKSGRVASDIDIIAVSKTAPIGKILEASKTGICKFGENRVQELLEKRKSIAVMGAQTQTDRLDVWTQPDRFHKQAQADQIKKHIIVSKCEADRVRPMLEWHFIGRLQTNKVKLLVGNVELIHSLDRFELAEEIQKCASARDIVVNTLVQVNISKEESKAGFFHENLSDTIYKLSKLPNIRVKGLMTIAPFVDDPENNRVYFREIHKVLVDIAKEKMDNVSMDVLSAGMSNDFEVAIEEGSNVIRVGAAVFAEHSNKR